MTNIELNFLISLLNKLAFEDKKAEPMIHPLLTHIEDMDNADKIRPSLG